MIDINQVGVRSWTLDHKDHWDESSCMTSTSASWVIILFASVVVSYYVLTL